MVHNRAIQIMAGLVTLANMAATTAVADVCVRNASSQAHVFAAEAPGGVRMLAELAPGEALCSSAVPQNNVARGVVSVYDSIGALEGCSRLVEPGQTEDMLRYSEFDRCAWGSNS